MARTKKSVREKEERKQREQLIQQCIAVAVDVRKPRGLKSAPRRQFGTGCPFGSNTYENKNCLGASDQHPQGTSNKNRFTAVKSETFCVDSDHEADVNSDHNNCSNNTSVDVIDLCGETDTCSSDDEKPVVTNDCVSNVAGVDENETKSVIEISEQFSDHCEDVSVERSRRFESSECKESISDDSVNKHIAQTVEIKNFEKCPKVEVNSSSEEHKKKSKFRGCINDVKDSCVKDNYIPGALEDKTAQETEICSLLPSSIPNDSDRLKVHSDIRTCLKALSSTSAAKIPVVCLTDILKKKCCLRQHTSRTKHLFETMESSCAINGGLSVHQKNTGSSNKTANQTYSSSLCNETNSNQENVSPQVTPASVKHSPTAVCKSVRNDSVNSQLDTPLSSQQNESKTCLGKLDSNNLHDLDACSSGRIESEILASEILEEKEEKICSSSNSKEQDLFSSGILSGKSPRNLFETFSLFSDDPSEKSSMCSTPSHKDSPTPSFLSPECQDKNTSATSPSKSGSQKVHNYSSGLGKLLSNRTKTIFKDVQVISSESESELLSPIVSSTKTLNSDSQKLQKSPQMSLFEKIMSDQKNNSFNDANKETGQCRLSDSVDNTVKLKNEPQTREIQECTPSTVSARNSEPSLFEKFMNFENFDCDSDSKKVTNIEISSDQKESNRDSLLQSNEKNISGGNEKQIETSKKDMKGACLNESVQNKTPKSYERSSLFETIFFSSDASLSADRSEPNTNKLDVAKSLNIKKEPPDFELSEKYSDKSDSPVYRRGTGDVKKRQSFMNVFYDLERKEKLKENTVEQVATPSVATCSNVVPQKTDSKGQSTDIVNTETHPLLLNDRNDKTSEEETHSKSSELPKDSNSNRNDNKLSPQNSHQIMKRHCSPEAATSTSNEQFSVKRGSDTFPVNANQHYVENKFDNNIPSEVSQSNSNSVLEKNIPHGDVVRCDNEKRVDQGDHSVPFNTNQSGVEEMTVDPTVAGTTKMHVCDNAGRSSDKLVPSGQSDTVVISDFKYDMVDDCRKISNAPHLISNTGPSHPNQITKEGTNNVSTHPSENQNTPPISTDKVSNFSAEMDSCDAEKDDIKMISSDEQNAVLSDSTSGLANCDKEKKGGFDSHAGSRKFDQMDLSEDEKEKLCENKTNSQSADKENSENYDMATSDVLSKKCANLEGVAFRSIEQSIHEHDVNDNMINECQVCDKTSSSKGLLLQNLLFDKTTDSVETASTFHAPRSSENDVCNDVNKIEDGSNMSIDHEVEGREQIVSVTDANCLKQLASDTQTIEDMPKMSSVDTVDHTSDSLCNVSASNGCEEEKNNLTMHHSTEKSPLHAGPTDLNTSNENLENDYYDDFVNVNFSDSEDSESEASSVIYEISSSSESSGEEDSQVLNEQSWRFPVNKTKSQLLSDLVDRVSDRVGVENLPKNDGSSDSDSVVCLDEGEKSDLVESENLCELISSEQTTLLFDKMDDEQQENRRNLDSPHLLKTQKSTTFNKNIEHRTNSLDTFSSPVSCSGQQPEWLPMTQMGTPSPSADKGSIKLVIKGGKVLSPANSSCVGLSPLNSSRRESLHSKSAPNTPQKDPVTMKLIRVPVPEGKSPVHSTKIKSNYTADSSSYDCYYPISKTQPSSSVQSSTSGRQCQSTRWKPKNSPVYLSSAHRSVKKLGTSKSIEVLLNPVKQDSNPISVFRSTDLEQYLSKTENLVLHLGSSNKKTPRKLSSQHKQISNDIKPKTENDIKPKTESDMFEDSFQTDKDVRKLPPEPNVQIPVEFAPDFDEIENVGFMSFPNEDSLSAHLEVEKKAKWGSSTAESLLDLCRVADLYEAEWKGDMKRKVRRAQMHHMTPCSQETWQGIHKKIRKYKKLYCIELDKLHDEQSGRQQFSSQKTSDITKIKGWKNKFIDKGELENAALSSLQESGRLHWKMEDKLVKNLSQTDLKELGLEYLKRRRRKPVTYTHKKEGRRKSPESELMKVLKDSSNIQGDDASSENYIDDSDNSDSVMDEDGDYSENVNLLDEESKRILLKLGGNLSITSCKESEKRVNPSVHATLTRRLVHHALTALKTSYDKLPQQSQEPCKKSRSEVAQNLEGKHVTMASQKKSCEKPGCRYGCICHLCQLPKKVLKRRSSKKNRECQEEYCRLGCICDDSASVSSTSSRSRTCDREHCRLGCVCESIHGDNESLISDAHCGKVECMLQCNCVKDDKNQMNSSSENLPTLTIEPDFLNKSLPCDTGDPKLDTAVNNERRRTKSVENPDKRNNPCNLSRYASLPKRESTYRLAKNLDAVNRKAKLIYETSEVYQEKKSKRRKESDIHLETLHDVDPSTIAIKNKTDLEEMSLFDEENSDNSSCARTSVYLTSRPRLKIVKTDRFESVCEVSSPPKTCQKPAEKPPVTASNVIDLCDSPIKQSESNRTSLGESANKTLPSSPLVTSPSSILQPTKDEAKVKSPIKHSPWKMQLVCLKPAKSSKDQGSVNSRLLTFTSNCDWNPSKTVILNKVASCITRDCYPDPQTMNVGSYKVEILPKPHKPTKRPNNVPREFQDALPNDIYAIRVRITKNVQDIVIDLVNEEKSVSDNAMPTSGLEDISQSTNLSNLNINVVKSIAAVAPIVKPPTPNISTAVASIRTTCVNIAPNIAPTSVVNVCSAPVGISGFRGLSITNTSKMIKFPSGLSDVKKTAMVRPSVSVAPQQRISDIQQSMQSPIYITTKNIPLQSTAGSADLSTVNLLSQPIIPQGSNTASRLPIPTSQIALVPIQQPGGAGNSPIKLLKLNPSEMQKLFAHTTPGSMPQAVKFVPVSIPNSLLTPDKINPQEGTSFPVTLQMSTPVSSGATSKHVSSSSISSTNVTFTVSHPVSSPLVYTSVSNPSNPPPVTELKPLSSDTQLSKQITSTSEIICVKDDASSPIASSDSKESQEILNSLKPQEDIFNSAAQTNCVVSKLLENDKNSNCLKPTSLDEDIEKIRQFVDDVIDSENTDTQEKESMKFDAVASNKRKSSSFSDDMSNIKKSKTGNDEQIINTEECPINQSRNMDYDKIHLKPIDGNSDQMQNKDCTLDIIELSDEDVEKKFDLSDTPSPQQEISSIDSSKWHTQMVCFKPTGGFIPSKMSLDSSESVSGHRLLEITSNCDWLDEKLTIFKRLSSYLKPGEYPHPMILWIKNFRVQILKKGKEPAKIPPEIKSSFNLGTMFSVRIKITLSGTETSEGDYLSEQKNTDDFNLGIEVVEVESGDEAVDVESEIQSKTILQDLKRQNMMSSSPSLESLFQNSSENSTGCERKPSFAMSSGREKIEDGTSTSLLLLSLTQRSPEKNTSCKRKSSFGKSSRHEDDPFSEIVFAPGECNNATHNKRERQRRRDMSKMFKQLSNVLRCDKQDITGKLSCLNRAASEIHELSNMNANLIDELQEEKANFFHRKRKLEYLTGHFKSQGISEDYINSYLHRITGFDMVKTFKLGAFSTQKTRSEQNIHGPHAGRKQKLTCRKTDDKILLILPPSPSISKKCKFDNNDKCAIEIVRDDKDQNVPVIDQSNEELQTNVISDTDLAISQVTSLCSDSLGVNIEPGDSNETDHTLIHEMSDSKESFSIESSPSVCLSQRPDTNSNEGEPTTVTALNYQQELVMSDDEIVTISLSEDWLND